MRLIIFVWPLKHRKQLDISNLGSATKLFFWLWDWR